jgi:hypothetical protein
VKPTSGWRSPRRTPCSRAALLYNFERGPLAMAGSRAREQRPDRVDGLSAAANHAADIALSELKSESGCSAARNFREHHVVGICDQLPNDELEKFSHDENANHKSALAQWLRRDRWIRIDRIFSKCPCFASRPLSQPTPPHSEAATIIDLSSRLVPLPATLCQQRAARVFRSQTQVPFPKRLAHCQPVSSFS